MFISYFFVMVNTAKSSIEKSQEFQLPKELQDEALQAEDNLKVEKNKSSVFSRPAAYLTAFTLALTLNAAGQNINQTTNNPLDTKNVTMKALDYTLMNVSKYYPDMKGYVQSLWDRIKSAGLTDMVNDALEETVMKSGYTEQELTAVIVACVEDLDKKSTFGDKNSDFFTDKMMADTETFRKVFDKKWQAEMDRVKVILVEKRKILAQKEKNLAQKEKNVDAKTIELRGYFAKRDVEQVKNSTQMQEALQGVEEMYEDFGIKPTNHEQALFNLIRKKQ